MRDLGEKALEAKHVIIERIGEKVEGRFDRTAGGTFLLGMKAEIYWRAAITSKGPEGSVMIRKVVIPSAGLGTRLLPATKEQPKEMLPVFARGADGQRYLKPLVQLVFEQLFELGFREFCFVIGRGKRAIEDHFTPDYEYVKMLRAKNKFSPAGDFESFYKKLEQSTLIWINQPEPRGFGDAVLKAQPTIGNEEFLVIAGDTYIMSNGHDHINRLIKAHQGAGSDASLLVQRIEDPRQYGVVTVENAEEGVHRVTGAVEKPDRPASNLAIMPVYAFHPVIFKALERTHPGKGGEIQLTDGIQMLISWGLKVNAVELRKDEVRLDIGNPDTYWEAVKLSYEGSVNPSDAE